MKKCTILFMIAAAMIFQLAAVENVNAGGRSDIRFWPSDQSTLKSGARGGMQYYPEDCEFCFDFGGIGLEREQNYTLVCGTNVNDLICLGTDTTNKYGQIHIKDCINIGDLCDVMVALVLTEDVDCAAGQMTVWRPEMYLLGACNINYVDTGETLDLWEKDPDTWDIIYGGAQGSLCYSPSGPEFSFKFEACGLVKRQKYTLIYYPDPWPGYGLICLGSGTANGAGKIKINGSVDTGDLPVVGDLNYPGGAKIWLVLSDDVDCDGQVMVNWNPTEYLFEDHLINYDDTDTP